MESLTIFYGYDSEDQIDKTFLSISSIRPNAKININILIFVSNEHLLIKTKQKISISHTKLPISVILYESINSVPKAGMYFWIFSPFHTKTDYILQLDNDTLVNCDLHSLIKSTYPNRSAINAVQIRFNHKYRVVKTIDCKIKSKYNIETSSNKFMKKWFNSGVVLIDRVKFINKIYDENYLINELYEYTNPRNYSDELKLSFSDEAFILTLFMNDISSLRRKYNLRLQSIMSTRIYMKKNDYIFHYNKKLLIDNTYEKVDFKRVKNDSKYWDLIKKTINNEYKNQKYYIDDYGEFVLNMITNDFDSIL